MAKKSVAGKKVDISGSVKSKILQTIKGEIAGAAKGGGSIHSKGGNFLRGHGKTANPFVKTTQSPKPR